MPITPTNITKNTTTPSNRVKRVSGGYGYARYGMSSYGATGSVNNIPKSTPSATRWVDMIMNWASATGSWASYGASAWANLPKN